MSKENVKAFYEFLKQDVAVVEELKKAASGIDSAGKAVALVIDFAAKKGFEFTAEELAAFEQESQRELSLEELDKINAAGAGGFCILLGFGWGGKADGDGITTCYVIGYGVGVSWKEADASPDKSKTSGEKMQEKSRIHCNQMGGPSF